MSQVKVVFLGEAAVGKSSLITRFVKEEFHANTPSTVAAAFVSKRVSMQTPGGSSVTLQLGLWDTAGQERFHSLAPIYYRGADAAIVAFDLTDSKSYAQAKTWVGVLRRELGDQVIILLAGNKVDLVRADESKRGVSTEEAQRYAKANELTYVETSAKEDIGIAELFTEMASRLAAKVQAGADFERKRGANVLKPEPIGETPESDCAC